MSFSPKITMIFVKDDRHKSMIPDDPGWELIQESNRYLYELQYRYDEDEAKIRFRKMLKESQFPSMTDPAPPAEPATST